MDRGRQHPGAEFELLRQRREGAPQGRRAIAETDPPRRAQTALPPPDVRADIDQHRPNSDADQDLGRTQSGRAGADDGDSFVTHSADRPAYQMLASTIGRAWAMRSKPNRVRSIVR